MEQKNRNAIIAVVAVVLFGVAALVSNYVLNGDSKPSAQHHGPKNSVPVNTVGPVVLTPSTSPTAVPTKATPHDIQCGSKTVHGYPYPEVASTGTVDAEEMPGQIEAATVVATSAIKAMTEQTYTDATPHDWLNRIASFTTPALQSALTKQYGSAQPDLAWAQAKDAKKVTQTTINSASATSMFDRNGCDVTLLVNYSGSSKVEGGSWTDGSGTLEKYVRLVPIDNGGWKVSQIDDPETRLNAG
jgi:hypothetical protein